MTLPSVLAMLIPLLAAAVGAAGALGGIYLWKWLDVRNGLRQECVSLFLKLYAIIDGLTEPNAPATQGWHEQYLSARTEVEGIGDALIARTTLLVSRTLADEVHDLRAEFRKWEAHWMISREPRMDPAGRAEALKALLEEHPARLRTTLASRTEKYRVTIGIR